MGRRSACIGLAPPEGWVAQNKETANIASVKDDARWFGRAAEGDYVPTSMICAPVLSRDGSKTLGVIQAARHATGVGRRARCAGGAQLRLPTFARAWW